jgi:acyl dehydratase
MSAAAPILADSVSVGDALPTLSVDVTPTTVVLGALASRDWRPMHHDYKFATERNGVADIFLNTPNQAAWFERYVTDWAGPRARLGRMTFRMRTSVFPGDRMDLDATVTDVSTDEVGQGWATLEVTLTATATDGRDPAPRTASTCSVRVALPSSDTDNPWSRRGDQWRP